MRRRASIRPKLALARAARALFASREPFEPYRTINRIQRAFPESVPLSTRCLLPEALHAAAAGRIRNVLMWGRYAHLVGEAVLSWHRPYRQARLCLPPSLWCVWPGGRRFVRKISSFLLFALFLSQRFWQGVRRIRQLVRNALTGPAAPNAPYRVSINVARDSLACAAHGGILPWLREEAPLPVRPAEIWVSSRHMCPSLKAGFPPWIRTVPEPFPRLASRGATARFLLTSGGMAIYSVASAWLGFWQTLALLPDLIELNYFRRLTDKQLPDAYVFFLDDLANRPLWSWLAEAQGCRTPLLFYASSYSLFSQGVTPVDAEIKDPSLLESRWTECWYQTQQAAALISHWSDSDTPSQIIVGAFDMTEGMKELPVFGKRSLAVFDVEPSARPFRQVVAGYLCPFLTEEIIVSFWEKLGNLAHEFDLVLVHKPKRPASHQRESRYRRQLDALSKEGRYIGLPTDVGPSRLFKHVTASVVLPFTSVGDLAHALDHEAVYFDPFGSIEDAHRHAFDQKVMAGEGELCKWAAAVYGPPVVRVANGTD